MNTPDTFTPGNDPDDPELRAAYEALEAESPPEGIDARIRANARAALTRQTPRWYVPAALAATVLLSFGLVTQITNTPGQAPVISETAPDAVDTTAPAPMPAAHIREEFAAEAPEDSAEPAAAPAPATRTDPGPASRVADAPPAIGGSESPAHVPRPSAPADGFARDPAPADDDAAPGRMAKLRSKAAAATAAAIADDAAHREQARLAVPTRQRDTDAGFLTVHADAGSGCVWLSGGEPMSPRALANALRNRTVNGLVAPASSDAAQTPAAVLGVQIAQAAGTRYYLRADDGALIPQPAGEPRPLSDRCDR